ncbi:hypothetical protein D3C81_731630 [compost metagenome]
MLASTAGGINARAGHRVNRNSTGRIARARATRRTVSAQHRGCASCGNATCRRCRHMAQRRRFVRRNTCRAFKLAAWRDANSRIGDGIASTVSLLDNTAAIDVTRLSTTYIAG